MSVVALSEFFNPILIYETPSGIPIVVPIPLSSARYIKVSGFVTHAPSTYFLKLPPPFANALTNEYKPSLLASNHPIPYDYFLLGTL